MLFCSGAQLNEALQMQMEVQRRLSDQLEVLFSQRHIFSLRFFFYTQSNTFASTKYLNRVVNL